MLSPQEGYVLFILVVAIGFIVTERLRSDLVAILVMVTLPLTGTITFQESLSGFSRSVVITIIGLFIITQALEDTGIVQWIANQVRAIGAGSEARLVVLFMTAGAILSLFMNNIAAGAVLLPAAVQVGRESDVPPSKLLIPVAFGTLVGGMATYFTTANIILSGILHDQNQPALSTLDFLPTGGLIALACLAFMALIGRHLLPKHESAAKSASAYLLSRRLSETYQLHEQLWEVVVPAGCAMVGNTLGDVNFGAKLGLNVMAIWRGHQAIFSPPPTETIQPDDFLLVMGDEESIRQLRPLGADIGRSDGHFASGSEYVVDLTEIVIPPRSTVVGKSMADLHFRNKYHLTGVALWRQGKSYTRMWVSCRSKSVTHC